ncbi:MAG: hypothetical protein JZU50_12940 [Desulfobulbaceae bacterium]|nr:hypothetical protein [Desulfobulbaceae bacterium]
MIKPACRFFWVATIFLTLLAASGCSDLNGTRLEPVLGGEVNLVKLGDTVAETLVAKMKPPLVPHQPVLVTTVVNNDNLDETTSFGRSFQNNIAAGLVARGYAVKEIKLRKNMLIEVNQGEFMLTRDFQELAGKQQAQAVVVGTYTMANRVMYLSIRLVNPVDQRIRATFEDKIVLDENNLRLLGLKLKNKAAYEETEIQPPKPSILDDLLY